MVNQSQNLVLRQSQNLVMTQSMQQSLKILQLSSLDLANYIEAELEKNPLLEVEGEEEKDKEEANSAQDQQNTDTENEDKDSFNEKDSFENLTSNNMTSNSAVLDDNSDSNWSSAENNFSSDNYVETTNNYNSEDDDTGSIIEKTYSDEPSLKEHLTEQVSLDFDNPKDKIIAAHIIDMIDPSGYLSSETLHADLISLSKQLGCSVEDIEEIISRLQKLDPLGVCSRNLKECLKIQLNEKRTLDPAIEKLVDNLEMLAKGEMDKLKRICDVSDEDLVEMIKEIKALNPRPGSGFSEGKAQTKHSDLILEKKNGKWVLELNQELFPRLNVRKDYYQKVKSNSLKAGEKKYISDNYSSANFLMRAINMRAETMLKVGNALMKRQEQFLEKGINYLKPISMREIAEEVGLHESTIGRVVSNKYITIPNGVYELRYFFTTGLSSIYNDNDVSVETVKHQIKEMIDAESKVLSDDDIAANLKAKGINIARRTVAKYRESMNIATSAVRKRLKKMNG